MKRFYKKKPVVVEAVQLTENNIKEAYEFVYGSVELKTLIDMGKWDMFCKFVLDDGMTILTLEDGDDGRAKHVASIGDWIIKGIKGEFYPCKPDIFEATYDLMYIDTEGEDIGEGSTTYMGSRDF